MRDPEREREKESERRNKQLSVVPSSPPISPLLLSQFSLKRQLVTQDVKTHHTSPLNAFSRSGFVPKKELKNEMRKDEKNN